MVSLEIVRQSNNHIASLSKGLVALFIGATAGIGQSTLKQFAQKAPSPRIYTVARPGAVKDHEELLASLRKSNPSAILNVITADISLIAEVDKVVKVLKEKESKLDLLVLTPGFLPWDGRHDTSEGLEPSMTTRYYSRQRALEQLLPLLNAAPSPRVVSVLAAGHEKPLIADDMDVRHPKNWSTWGASVQVATMLTLGLEDVAAKNPGLSLVHLAPGVVATRGLARMKKFIDPPNARDEDEAGAICLFVATNDRFAVRGGLVPVPNDLGPVQRSGGGVFMVGPGGDLVDNEEVLATLRLQGDVEKVSKFTQGIFATATGARS